MNQDLYFLEYGKKLYTIGKYKESLFILNKLIEKYKNYNIYNSFYIDLLFSYSNICSIFNIKFNYFDKLNHIIKELNNINISQLQKDFCKFIYTSLCLQNKNYKMCYNYLNNFNNITGPGVNKNNMSFFKKDDKNKKLLIYDGGGLGDLIMLSRFIPKLCSEYSGNEIIFFIHDRMIWLFNEYFKNIKNLRIVSVKMPFLIGHFDYHCNMLSLIKHLNYGYNTIEFEPFLKNINLKITDNCQEIIKNIKKNTYILNWKGNIKNSHEKFNRGMNLKYAIPLFKLKDINWLVISKNITEDEREILNKYKIKYIGDKIDKDKAFYDSISIIKNVKAVISTDTSLPHLSLTLGVKTYVLLTLGCEWRWTRDKKTMWYPEAELIRQTEIFNWEDVIKKLGDKINSS